MELVVGIDPGTGSAKGVLADASGAVLAIETIPQARGVVAAGLTLRHGRGHPIRAAFEGISFGIR